MSDYDPADHNKSEVEAYVEENPSEAKAVLEAEQARGDDTRSTLVSSLQKVVDGQQEAPVPTEPKPVTVAPSETPTQSFFGKDYEVSSDRGHRVKG